MEKWDVFFELREKALPWLERARQRKDIGKSLDAHLIITIRRLENRSASVINDVLKSSSEFQEILNVSSLEIRRESTPQSGIFEVPVSVGESLGFQITVAVGEKCERCWHRETTIGLNFEHSTLCARCVEAVINSHFG